MILSVFIIISIWMSTLSTCCAENILLIFPFFSRSEFGFHTAIARSLHSVGHKITVVHAFPHDPANENFTVIDASRSNSPSTSNYFSINEAMQFFDDMSIFSLAVDETELDCHNTLRKKRIQEIINSPGKKFDVIILNMVGVLFECFSPIAEILEIPIIGTTSARSWRRTDRIIGNPSNSAVVPSELLHLPGRMSFAQRLKNTFYCIYEHLFDNIVIFARLETLYKKYFPNSSAAQRPKPSLIFVNSHQIFAPRALTPNVVYIGGIQVQPPKPLPQKLQKFIDEAESGVFLFTVGSFLRMFEPNSTEFHIFATVFAQIPQRVIWKMEDEVEDLPKNVMISKWLPQRDILAHKNVIGFITHCGVSGMYESVFEAKPMVLMPEFFDQTSNAAVLEELGVGVFLDIRTLTRDKLLFVLNAIANDTRYRERMQSISQIVKDRPMTLQETVVYWTEYVIRQNGAPQLRTVAADMPLYRYLLLDVILFVFITSFAIIYIASVITKKVERLLQLCWEK